MLLYLLDCGANVNFRGTAPTECFDQTPLSLACAESLVIVNFLLEHGAHITDQCLYNACNSYNALIVQRLLQEKVLNVNSEVIYDYNEIEYTGTILEKILFYLINDEIMPNDRNAAFTIASLLIEHGGSAQAALSIICEQYYKGKSALEVISFLLERGAKANVSLSDKIPTPLTRLLQHYYKDAHTHGECVGYKAYQSCNQCEDDSDCEDCYGCRECFWCYEILKLFIMKGNGSITEALEIAHNHIDIEMIAFLEKLHKHLSRLSSDSNPREVST
jgi:hypothetical protein